MEKILLLFLLIIGSVIIIYADDIANIDEINTKNSESIVKNESFTQPKSELFDNQDIIIQMAIFYGYSHFGHEIMEEQQPFEISFNNGVGIIKGSVHNRKQIEIIVDSITREIVSINY